MGDQFAGHGAAPPGPSVGVRPRGHFAPARQRPSDHGASGDGAAGLRPGGSRPGGHARGRTRTGTRPAGVSVLAAAFAGAGALATILACAFSIVHFYNSDGTYASSESLFSISSRGAAWNWIGLVVAAVLSVVAALLLVASRTPWVRAGAAGVVGAFGIAVILIFATYQFTLGPVSDGSGPAGGEKLGAFGGLLLLVAGVLGFVAAARGDRAVTPPGAPPAE